MFLVTAVFNFFQTILILIWDLGVALLNLLSPRLKVGHVTPAGHPGADGKWPKFVPPKEGDSRCGCAGLNALANHGILPHDGKNIPFKDITLAVRAAYNIGGPIAYFVPSYAAAVLDKKYKGTFDLSDLNKIIPHGIEHNASFTRQDNVDPSSPDIGLVKSLLALASGHDKDGSPTLTHKDFQEFSAKRRLESQAQNPDSRLSFFHKGFGSANAALMLKVFGGRVADLDTFLAEERFPDGWESRVRSRFGLSFASYNATIMKVELGINEKKYQARQAQVEPGDSEKKDV